MVLASLLMSTTAVSYTHLDFSGSYIATQHLIENGHTQIAFLGGEQELTNPYRRRLEGYLEALNNYGVPRREELIRLTSYQMASGDAGVQDMVEKGCDFTAIVCGNDIMAAGALKALHRNGRQVPRDISLVGYDDTYLADVYKRQGPRPARHRHRREYGAYR